MLILIIRTDRPKAEVGLYKDSQKIAFTAWEAHKKLSVTIHEKIKDILSKQNLTLKDLEGIAVFKGPGSFTGLRIGLTVGNAFSYALDIPIVSTAGEDWIDESIERLESGENEQIAMPHYGSEPHISHQKK